jgi:hypothetical protein
MILLYFKQNYKFFMDFIIDLIIDFEGKVGKLFGKNIKNIHDSF